jgi:hypothetical protein
MHYPHHHHRHLLVVLHSIRMRDHTARLLVFWAGLLKLLKPLVLLVLLIWWIWQCLSMKNML